jgi:hypothetical protein
MSQTIYYQPIKGKAIDTPTPSALLEKMDKVFDCGFSELGQDDLDRLRVLAVFYPEIKALISAVETAGDVRVWIE